MTPWLPPRPGSPVRFDSDTGQAVCGEVLSFRRTAGGWVVSLKLTAFYGPILGPGDGIVVTVDESGRAATTKREGCG
jgi:hypothetical protein